LRNSPLGEPPHVLLHMAWNAGLMGLFDTGGQCHAGL